MPKLTREALWSLEQYAAERPEFRVRVREHKKSRRVAVGDHATLYFEDALTMKYQVQEMLRAERIFEPEGIDEELGAYNPLIPDGSNWKCTFMIEYTDVEERRAALEQMIGIEDRIWVQVHDFDAVWAIADEDLKRDNERKTSAVHFLRFELDPKMINALKSGANIAVGIDHDAYREEVSAVSEPVRLSLMGDLD
jgi:hypothetical protein